MTCLFCLWSLCSLGNSSDLAEVIGVVSSGVSKVLSLIDNTEKTLSQELWTRIVKLEIRKSNFN
jgi:hypothetical protein